MVTPDEIRKKATAQYGLYLRNCYGPAPDSFFPLVIRCDKKMDFATPKEMEDGIMLLQSASDEKCAYGYSIDYDKKSTKMFATQSIPVRIYFKSDTDFLKFIRKEKDTAVFHRAMKRTVSEFPELKETLLKHYELVVKCEIHWEDILKVCRYFKAHPKPGRFVRELPIGVHTKFVENNRKILRELLDAVVGEENIDAEAKTFYGRFHLKEGDPMMAFRILDETLSRKYFAGLTFLNVYVCEMARLSVLVRRVIIVENLRNLSQIIDLVPRMPSTIVLWGSGYKVNVLKDIEWLKNTEIFYWGDIDAQGYEILSNIRLYLPQIKSVMMDMEAMKQHPTKVEGVPADRRKTMNLTETELEAYEYVRTNVVRFEQELLPETYVIQQLNMLSEPV